MQDETIRGTAGWTVLPANEADADDAEDDMQMQMQMVMLLLMLMRLALELLVILALKLNCVLLRIKGVQTVARWIVRFVFVGV